jgi:hypothetical protein
MIAARDYHVSGPGPPVVNRSRRYRRAMSEEDIELTHWRATPSGAPEAVVSAGYMLSALFDKHG